MIKNTLHDVMNIYQKLITSSDFKQSARNQGKVLCGGVEDWRQGFRGGEENQKLNRQIQRTAYSVKTGLRAVDNVFHVKQFLL
jgi:hypothetical protein